MDDLGVRLAFERALAFSSPGFGTFFLARLLELEISYADETCTVGLTPAEWMFNPQGSLHGGIISTVLDISMGHLLHHTAGAGVTLEMKTQYLRPVPDAEIGGPVSCVAGFLKRGRSINFLESCMQDRSGKVMAAASSTWRLLDAGNACSKTR